MSGFARYGRNQFLGSGCAKCESSRLTLAFARQPGAIVWVGRTQVLMRARRNVIGRLDRGVTACLPEALTSIGTVSARRRIAGLQK